jgi:DNA-binding transcriptional ArsR family regulator
VGAPWTEEERLRDRIVEHLRRVDHDSISGIARALSEGREAPLHRLTAAGYLQALAEAGILKEMERPPSKEYKLASPELHWSLHQRVHQALQDPHRREDEQARLALAILQTTFGRPLFHAELLHAGYTAPALAGLPRIVVEDRPRRIYRDLFERRLTPRIEIPSRDPLHQLPEDDPALRHPLVQETLRRLLARATGADHLVAERLAPAAQATLDLGGPA